MSNHAQPLSNWQNPACTSAESEALARELYERLCRDDTFDDLKRRAVFDRQDAGRLKHWVRASLAMLKERSAMTNDPH